MTATAAPGSAGRQLDVRPLAFELGRPYFDLGPVAATAPLHAFEPAYAFEDLEAGDPQRLGPAMSMTAMFRQLLVHETGLHGYAASTPSDLAPDLRTPAWQHLCSLLARWHTLDHGARLSVARVMIALTFAQAACDRLNPRPSTDEIRVSRDAASLAWLSGYAQFVTAPRLEREPPLIALVAKESPRGSLARVFAASLLVVVHSEWLRDVRTGAGWLSELQRLVDEAEGLDADDEERLRIRYRLIEARHRVAVGESDRAAATIEAARTAAERIPERSGRPGVLRREGLRRVLDSQSRIARGRNDRELALAAARSAVEIDSSDSKAHLLLGNLLFEHGDLAAAQDEFRRAAQLGPLFTGRAAFMLGVCAEHAGSLEEAADAYARALRVDPTSSSAAVALVRCATMLPFPSLREWGLEAVRRLAAAHLIQPDDELEVARWT
jgi:tetratricopeptide (TPR) repeat protein